MAAGNLISVRIQQLLGLALYTDTAKVGERKTKSARRRRENEERERERPLMNT